MTDFYVDIDIRRAKTLPSDFYINEDIFERSREEIFSRTWQLLGSLDVIETLWPITLLPGFLDEPLLVARNLDDYICLSNVCTHRGKILVEEPCTADLIKCGYHGRRFDLEGNFLSMPEFENVVDFPSPADNLKRLPLAHQGVFLLTSLAPIAGMNEFFDEKAVPYADFQPEGLELVSSREYEINAHWALYCENYLEGFHIPFVHKSLNAMVDYGTYKTETFQYSSLQTGFDGEGNVAGRYLFVFPNLMFNFYPWGISVNVVRPVTPARSVVEYFTYVCDESKLGSGAGSDLDRVELEDEAVVESVQKGIRSRFYKQGRYSPTREQGTHHFHRLIAEFMGRTDRDV